MQISADFDLIGSNQHVTAELHSLPIPTEYKCSQFHSNISKPEEDKKKKKKNFLCNFQPKCSSTHTRKKAVDLRSNSRPKKHQNNTRNKSQNKTKQMETLTLRRNLLGFKVA
jgi:hypothetical protein